MSDPFDHQMNQALRAVMIARETLGDEAVSERKLRLFGYHCCRRLSPFVSVPWRKVIDAALLYAEGQIAILEFSAAFQGCNIDGWPDPHDAINDLRYACPYSAVEVASRTAARAEASLRSKPSILYCGVRQIQYGMLRSIFGHLLIAPYMAEVNNKHVHGLATAFYEQEDPQIPPVLADALEEAGERNADALNHLRKEPVYKGDYVIDKILGKL